MTYRPFLTQRLETGRVVELTVRQPYPQKMANQNLPSSNTPPLEPSVQRVAETAGFYKTQLAPLLNAITQPQWSLDGKVLRRSEEEKRCKPETRPETTSLSGPDLTKLQSYLRRCDPHPTSGRSERSPSSSSNGR